MSLEAQRDKGSDLENDQLPLLSRGSCYAKSTQLIPSFQVVTHPGTAGEDVPL